MTTEFVAKLERSLNIHFVVDVHTRKISLVQSFLRTVRNQKLRTHSRDGAQPLAQYLHNIEVDDDFPIFFGSRNHRKASTVNGNASTYG